MHQCKCRARYPSRPSITQLQVPTTRTAQPKAATSKTIQTGSMPAPSHTANHHSKSTSTSQTHVHPLPGRSKISTVFFSYNSTHTTIQTAFRLRNLARTFVTAFPAGVNYRFSILGIVLLFPRARPIVACVWRNWLYAYGTCKVEGHGSRQGVGLGMWMERCEAGSLGLVDAC